MSLNLKHYETRLLNKLNFLAEYNIPYLATSKVYQNAAKSLEKKGLVKIENKYDSEKLFIVILNKEV